MNGSYAAVFGSSFNKKFKIAFKKHKGCFEKDFDNVKRSILVDFEQTRNTREVPGLGKKYCELKVYKTRMVITELKGYHARVIWHPCHKKMEILFIDVYLKNKQTNHDLQLIISNLCEYYQI